MPEPIQTETREIYGWIYVVFCNESEKVNVGQVTRTDTRNAAVRVAEHLAGRCPGCRHFYNAVIAYGPEAFTLLFTIEAFSKEELDTIEDLWIIALRAKERAFGYNLKDGGAKGKPGEETKELQSKSAKRRFERPEEIGANRQRALDRWANPDSRQKMAVAIARGSRTPEARKRNSEAAKRRQGTPEAREANSKRAIQWFDDNPEKAAVRTANLVTYAKSPEGRQAASKRVLQKLEDDPPTKQAFVERMKLYWSIPENAAMRGRAAAKYFSNPEVRLAFSIRSAQRMASPEAREAHGKKVLNWIENNPEEFQAFSKKRATKLGTPEVRKKMSDAQARRFEREKLTPQVVAKRVAACKATKFRKKCEALLAKQVSEMDWSPERIHPEFPELHSVS